jgi:hypothetical protein
MEKKDDLNCSDTKRINSSVEIKDKIEKEMK